jgi:hypothetical protein
MTAEYAVLVDGGDGRRDEVFIVDTPNAATARGVVAERTDTPRNELEFVQHQYIG